MKKITALLIALTLIVAMACPVFADTTTNANDTFRVSPIPDFDPDPVPFDDVEGYEGTEPVIGIIRDADGNVAGYVTAGCLQITTLGDVMDETKTVDEEICQLLEGIYNAMLSGEMEIPYEKHDEKLNDDNMVVRSLFDLRFLCEDHKAMLEQEGYTLEVRLNVGIEADTTVYAMYYDEEAEEWNPIVSSENNNDGTITCVFDQLCAVEFSVESAEE